MILFRLVYPRGPILVKIIKSAVFIAAVCLSLKSGYAQEAAAKIPGDFELTAIAGGVAPGTKVSKVEIDAKGNGIYFEAGTSDKGGSFVEKGRFSLEEPAMRFIYEAISVNDFFSLEKEYAAQDVLDGNSARLTITSNAKNHSVKTRNIRVERFDNIMIAVNIALPADKKVIYNEILDF